MSPDGDGFLSASLLLSRSFGSAWRGDHLTFPGSHNPAIRIFAAAGFYTECMQTPRSLRIFHSDWTASFTSTMRMVVGVHGFPTHFRTLSSVTIAAGFTDRHFPVVRIRYTTHGGVALFVHKTHFSGGELHLSILTIQGNKFCSTAGSFGQLSFTGKVNLML